MREEFHVAKNTIVAFDKVHDAFGFLQDTCEVIETKDDGHKVIYPYHPPLKLKTYTYNTPIFFDSQLKFDFDDALEIYEKHKQLEVLKSV